MFPSDIERPVPITSWDVCGQAGISYRQLDYWCRLGIIEPVGAASPGSGSQRRFTAREIRVVAFVARLYELGARAAVVKHVAPLVRAMGHDEWTGYLIVSPEGRVGRAIRPECGWIVDLDLCNARAAL